MNQRERMIERTEEHSPVVCILSHIGDNHFIVRFNDIVTNFKDYSTALNYFNKMMKTVPDYPYLHEIKNWALQGWGTLG